MASSLFKEGWLVVNDVPSHVLTWGGWVEDTLSDSDSVIFCIPGNPGLTSYYHNFLDSLHQQLRIPIWVVSHAGHEWPPSSLNMELPQDPKLYDLAGQVAHKMAFLKQYLVANKKLYLIGHSVGAKIILELLKDKQIAKHTEKCYLMMPTIVKIRETPNGEKITFFLRYFTFVLIMISWVLTVSPEIIRRFLIGCFFTITGVHNVDEKCIDACCHLALPEVLRKSLSLGLDELAVIKELDVQVLKDHHSKLKLIMAKKDDWVPLSYVENIRQVEPELDISILGEHVSHAFVLENSHEMAELLTNEIKKQQAKS